MGLKINFTFEILGILIQNPNIQQAFFCSKSPYSAGIFLFKIPIFSNDRPPDQKSFSDFAEIFFIISSEKIKLLNFRKFVKQLSYGFKNQF